MSPSENSGDKATLGANSISISPTTLLAVLLIVATYPFMPDSVPSHWNAAGQVNGYLPKLVNVKLRK
jgi:uncharacterized membrane protein